MRLPASVEGRERLRLFCALTLPEDVLGGIERWQRAALSSGARVVPRGHLHITLAFLGSRPVSELDAIAGALRAVAAGAVLPVTLRPLRYCETRSVGMLVLEDEKDRAARVATDLHSRLERLGVYEPERRSWLPHVTVLRFRRHPQLRPSLPDLGAFSPSDTALYHSLLRSDGAQYEILESVALGG